MKIKFLEAGVVGLSLLSATAPYLAFAQSALPSGPNSPNELLLTFCAIARWFFTFLILLSVIFVIYAAFRYLTAAGDPEKVKGANHALIYAAVAVAVAVLAKAVPLVVGGLVSPGGIGGIPGGC